MKQLGNIVRPVHRENYRICGIEIVVYASDYFPGRNMTIDCMASVDVSAVIN